jgi:hypothetical protein
MWDFYSLPLLPMPNFQVLSDTFRLTPWSLQEHADYVLQEYGKLLSRPDAAQAYVDGYKDAEEKFDQAYANQQEFLNRTTMAVGAQPQVLPVIQRIDWDPVKRLAAITAATQAPVEVAPTPAPTVAPVEAPVVATPDVTPVADVVAVTPDVVIPPVETLTDQVA